MERDEPLSPSQFNVRSVLGSPSPCATLPCSSTASSHVQSPPALTPPANSAAPTIVWFRGHDLRVHDHAALDAAIASGNPVVALYVLERGAEEDGAVPPASVRRSSPTHAHGSDASDDLSHLSDVSAPFVSSSEHRRASTSYYTATSAAHDDQDQEQRHWHSLSSDRAFELGKVQRWYLHHSLRVLRHQLQKLSITLILRRVHSASGTAVQVLSIARALGAASVFWNRRHKPRAYPVDDAVKSGMRRRHVVAHGFDSEMLITPSADYGTFHDFQAYARFWLNHMRVTPPSRPNPPIHPNNVCSLPRHVVQSLLASAAPELPRGSCCALSGLPSVDDLELLAGFNFSGHESPGQVSTIGCVAATRTLERFLRSDRFSRYASDKARRDGMVTGDDLATSRLSPHIRFGEISPRLLFWSVVDAGCEAAAREDSGGLSAARQFLKNISLREFGYYMLSRYPSAAYKPIVPEFQVFPWEEDADGALTRAWQNGTTGFPIVDAAMRQLAREGWLHNRMRFLAASFYCKYLLLPWPVGAAHMVRTLVDGDEASNSLGWQWTAGCNSDSFPFSTLVNPLSLYNHTRSRSTAAEYVRKYVPELAHLPDHLLFAPWSASDEERATYKLLLAPLRQYNKICPSSVFKRVVSEDHRVVYPMRVVCGLQARHRARTAMEVMRRIFASKRLPRPLWRDYTSLWRKDYICSVEREKARVTIVELEDSSDLPKSSTKSELSYVTSSCATNKSPPLAGIRRGEPNTTLNEPPSKRPRIMLGHERSRSQQPMHRTESQLSSDMLLSPRLESSGRYGVMGRHQLGKHTNSDAQVQTTKLPRATFSRKAVDIMDDGRTPEMKSPSWMKRPRSPSREPMRPLSTPRISDPCESAKQSSSDERLSVRSLLSPNLSSPPLRPLRSSISLNTKRVTAEVISGSGGLPKLAQVAAIQRDAQMSHHHDGSLGALAQRRFPRPPPRVGVVGEKNTDGDPMPSPTPSGTANTLLNRSNSSLASEGISEIGAKECTRQMNQAVQSAVMLPSSQTQPPPTRDRDGGVIPAKAIPVLSSHSPGHFDGSQHTNMHRNDGVQNVPFNPCGTAPAAMFHPHSIPVTLMGSQFNSTQHHAAQMLMPFAHASGHLPMQTLTHHPGSVPSQNAQGYFSMNPVGAAHHHPPGSPFTWYPTMAPYMELRPSTVPATMLSHMAHPFMHSGQSPIATPYQVDRRNLTPHTAPQCVPGQPSKAGKLEGSRRRGPTTPLEREGIARRMAAMDYTDETYGGKHWEQWQAISLHLLNLYEFSEDTDRDTTRAYVRLCVLKDELRSANPNGPRVTVNHCKEVFRILNLPVTGEWDRRGHGGVRGPYVYGCMKRNSHRVPR